MERKGGREREGETGKREGGWEGLHLSLPSRAATELLPRVQNLDSNFGLGFTITLLFHKQNALLTTQCIVIFSDVLLERKGLHDILAVLMFMNV